MSIDTLKTEYSRLLVEAQSIIDKYPNGNMPAEEQKNLTATLGRTDTIQAQIGLAKQLSEHKAAYGEPMETPAIVSSRPSAPSEGQPMVDEKAWRSFSVQVKNRDGIPEPVEFRYQVPEKVQKKGYGSAFESYLRKGRDSVGPSDMKLLQETVDTAGGFLIPEDFQARLVQKIAVNAVIRQLATVLTSSRDVLSLPRVNYGADNLHVIPGRPIATGEVPASSTAARVTDPTFGKVEINVNTVMMTQLISNDFLEDQQFDILNWTADKFAEEYGLYEETKFLNGTGANEAYGLITSVGQTNGITAYYSGATAAPFATLAGIVNAEAQLPPQYEKNARWIASKAAYGYYRQIADSQGRPLWPIVYGASPLGALPTSLLDYPILKSQFMPDITTANNIGSLLGDFKGYYIVDRTGFSIQRLMEVYAEVNATGIVARKRFGGQVVEPWRFVAIQTHL